MNLAKKSVQRTAGSSAKMTLLPFPGSGQPDRGKLVSSILRVSEAMLLDAEASRWMSVGRHDEDRQRLAWQLAQTPLNAREKTQWTQDLTRIMSISRRLTELANNERQQVIEELGQLRRKRKVECAYDWAAMA